MIGKMTRMRRKTSKKVEIAEREYFSWHRLIKGLKIIDIDTSINHLHMTFFISRRKRKILIIQINN